jgi:hypothetical protein
MSGNCCGGAVQLAVASHEYFLPRRSKLNSPTEKPEPRFTNVGAALVGKRLGSLLSRLNRNVDIVPSVTLPATPGH